MSYNSSMEKRSLEQLIRLCTYLQDADYLTVSSRINSFIYMTKTNKYCFPVFSNIFKIDIDLDKFIDYNSDNYFRLPSNIEEQIIVLIKLFEKYYLNRNLNFMNFIQAIYYNLNIEEGTRQFVAHFLKPFSIEIISYIEYIMIKKEEGYESKICIENFFFSEYSQLLNSIFSKQNIPNKKTLNEKKIIFSMLDEEILLKEQEKMKPYYSKFAYCHNSNNLDKDFINEFLSIVIESTGSKGVTALYKICYNRDLLEIIYNSYAYV